MAAEMITNETPIRSDVETVAASRSEGVANGVKGQKRKSESISDMEQRAVQEKKAKGKVLMYSTCRNLQCCFLAIDADEIDISGFMGNMMDEEKEENEEGKDSIRNGKKDIAENEEVSEGGE